MMIDKAEAEVLDTLRERSDEQHEKEWVTTDEFPQKLLYSMAERRLVRLSGPFTDPYYWITKNGIAALLEYEKNN